MAVVLLIAAVVIIGGVAVVAMGRGGEMAQFNPDVPAVNADIETAADVALLRPPAALWGYDKRATDEALNAVAQSVTERDVEIAALRQQLADMRGGAAATVPDRGETWEPSGTGGAATPDWSVFQRPVPPGPDDHAWPGAPE